MATQRELAISEGPADKGGVQQLFRERVALLPDVLRVEEHEDERSGVPSFKIFVRPGDREAQYAVYELEAEVYQRCRGAHLDVQVVVDASYPGSDSSPQSDAQ